MTILSPRRTHAFAAMLTCLLPLSVSAADLSTLEVRFCPAGQVRTYPAESAHGVQSLVLHNAAIINRGHVRTEVSAIDVQLLQGDHVVDARSFNAEDLQKVGKSGAALQASGMMKLVSFQFCGADLIPEGTVLAGPVLEPGQALLITQQPFVYKGSRDKLRIVAHAVAGGEPVEAAATLPIDASTAKTHLRFPLKGTWAVVVGPTLHTAHRWALPEEFGFDIARFGADTSSHKAPGERFSDYYAYAQPVFAAAAGKVIAAVGDVAENPEVLRKPGESEDSYSKRVDEVQSTLLAKGPDALAGNYVLIDHGQSEFSLYAHLKTGSVRVKAGDTVKAGDKIGEVGSSGNSTEPHLHFQVCDRPATLNCAGIPIQFEGIVLPYADTQRPLQSGDIVEAPSRPPS